MRFRLQKKMSLERVERCMHTVHKLGLGGAGPLIRLTTSLVSSPLSSDSMEHDGSGLVLVKFDPQQVRSV